MRSTEPQWKHVCGVQVSSSFLVFEILSPVTECRFISDNFGITEYSPCVTTRSGCDDHIWGTIMRGHPETAEHLMFMLQPEKGISGEVVVI